MFPFRVLVSLAFIDYTPATQVIDGCNNNGEEDSQKVEDEELVTSRRLKSKHSRFLIKSLRDALNDFSEPSVAKNVTLDDKEKVAPIKKSPVKFTTSVPFAPRKLPPPAAIALCDKGPAATPALAHNEPDRVVLSNVPCMWVARFGECALKARGRACPFQHL